MSPTRWFSILCTLFLLALTVSPTFAAAITVDTLTDGLGVAGCSLREAIANANNDNAAQVGCGTGSGADVITLNVSGTYTLLLANGGEIDVTSDIDIVEGGGVSATISGNNTSRVFNISTAGGNLTLTGLVVQNGSDTTAGGCIQVGASSGGAITFNNGTLQNCVTTNSGGAIGSVGATHSITISGSTLQNNTSGINGGAISQTGTASTLSISGSTFTSNRAGTGTGGSFGGAILYAGNNTGSFSVSSSTFSSNRAESTTANGRGGAIHFTASNVALTGTITGSTFTSNQALVGDRLGGAIYKSGVGTLNVISSVFTGNSADEGGAFYNAQGNLSVTSSRIQTNTASTNGGAYYSVGGTDSISASCIVNNGDTAVVDTEQGADTIADGNGNIAQSNWWGSSWGPLITAAGGGSAVSNGDSISGDGNNSGEPAGNIATVHVNLTNPGSLTSAPTGNWLTVAPTVAGATCMTCTGASSIGHARFCS